MQFYNLAVTWNGCDLFSSHPQEISDIQLPDIKGHSVSLKLFDQILLAVVAAAAQKKQGAVNVMEQV